MFITTFCSTLFYILTMLIIPETLVVAEVLNLNFWLNSIIILLFSWFPIFLT